MSPVRFPGEDGGRSLAEMAQRDLDAALQLLADRAQFITGASGAAIALRRRGMNDMLCRASAGSNAPELGALLSTEFGLSGESVRTRQLLRCDDAERDARVNHDVCRQLGIASVVVMPVVNDDEVLGVFELFSGKANAFGERDLSAVQRLSEMVETAVRLAHAAETLPEQLGALQVSSTEVASDIAVASASAEDQVLEDEILEFAADSDQKPVVEDPQPVLEQPQLVVKQKPAVLTVEAESAQPLLAEAPAPHVAPVLEVATPQEPVMPATLAAKPVIEPTPATEAKPPKTKLLWSAALNSIGDAAAHAESDQSHVPPVLRGLRKCEACGFPISASRVLCVECEEKKWRGQLKVPQPAAARTPAKAVPAVPVPASPKSEGLALAAAAQSSMTPRASAPLVSREPSFPSAVQTLAPTEKKEEDAIPPVPVGVAVETAVSMTSEARQVAAELSSPNVVFSAGLEPSQSWVAANKYILGALVIAAILTAVFLLR